MKFLLISLLCLACSPVWSSSYLQRLDYLDSIRSQNIPKVKAELEVLSKEYDKFNNQEKAKYYFIKAHSESIRGNYNAAYQYANQVKLYTREKDLIARTDSLKIAIYSHKGEIQKAFVSIYELLDRIEQLDNNQIKLDILLNAQTVHTYTEILDKAQEIGLRALALSNQMGLSSNRCRVGSEMGLLQIRLKKYETARDYFDKAKQVCDPVDGVTTLLIVESQLAKLNMLEKDYELAEKQYFELHKKLQTFGWDGLLVDTQIRMSELFLKMNKLDRVTQFALPAYDSAKESGQQNDLADASLVLARYYKQNNQEHKAMLYRKEFIRASSELKMQLQKRRLAYYQAMNSRTNRRDQNLKLGKAENTTSSPTVKTDLSQ